MKRIIILFAIVLAGTMCFAQKANINKAKAKAYAEENPDFDEAKALIEAALNDPSTKDLALTLWTAADIYNRSAMNERSKGDGHEEAAGTDALRALDLYKQAYERDQMPDAKGKIKPKYDKKIKEALANLYKSYILVNYSVKKQQDQEWAAAYEGMDKHIGILDLDMVKNDAKLAQDTSLRKGNTYNQLRYFAGVFAWSAGMRPEALVELQGLIGTGYQEENVYEQICTIYEEMGDTVNYLSALKAGAKAVPQSQWLTGNLINHYVAKGQYDEAKNYLTVAIANNPTAQLYNVLGSLNEELGELKEAMANYTIAVGLDDNYADAHANIGRFYYNRAMRLEDASLKTNDPATLKQYKDQMQEYFAQAVPEFERAYELNRDNSDFQRMLRITYYRLRSSNEKYQPKYPELLPQE